MKKAEPQYPAGGVRAVQRWSVRLLPAHQVGTPGEAAAACVEHYQIVIVNPVVLERLVQSDGYRGGGGIAVTIDVGEHLFRWQPEPLDHCIDDPQISLVRH